MIELSFLKNSYWNQHNMPQNTIGLLRIRYKFHEFMINILYVMNITCIDNFGI